MLRRGVHLHEDGPANPQPQRPGPTWARTSSLLRSSRPARRATGPSGWRRRPPARPTPPSRPGSGSPPPDCCTQRNVPRSVSHILWFPVERIFSTKGFMSQGARNCPFFTFTILPVLPAATSRSVWRQRKAGIWSTSATWATGAACSGVWMSVTTGSSVSSLTWASNFSPCFQPRTAKTIHRSPVSLVKGALEHRNNIQPFHGLQKAVGHLQRHAGMLQDARTGDDHGFGPAQFIQINRLHCTSARPGGRRQAFSALKALAARMNSRNRGWGCMGLDLNSGWNWQPRNQG